MDEVHWLAPIPNNWNGFCRDQWIYVLCCLSPQLVFYRGTLCTSIEEPLPSKWASRALKYLHSGFKSWTRLPQVLIMEEIETFPVLRLSAVRGWSQEHGLDSGQQCKVMSHVGLLGSLFCIYFKWLYTPVVTLLLLSYSHRDISNWSLHHTMANL